MIQNGFQGRNLNNLLCVVLFNKMGDNFHHKIVLDINDDDDNNKSVARQLRRAKAD